jgi:hypothetical protein
MPGPRGGAGLSSTARARHFAVGLRVTSNVRPRIQPSAQTPKFNRAVTDDQPEYSISEFVMCGLFLGGALCFFIYAGHAFSSDEPYDALEGAGLGLLLLGGSTDPKKYVIDCVTFPVTFMESSGRDTGLTVFAALLGTALWLTGLACNWFL